MSRPSRVWFQFGTLRVVCLRVLAVACALPGVCVCVPVCSQTFGNAQRVLLHDVTRACVSQAVRSLVTSQMTMPLTARSSARDFSVTVGRNFASAVLQCCRSFRIVITEKQPQGHTIQSLQWRGHRTVRKHCAARANVCCVEIDMWAFHDMCVGAHFYSNKMSHPSCNVHKSILACFG